MRRSARGGALGRTSKIQRRTAHVERSTSKGGGLAVPGAQADDTEVVPLLGEGEIPRLRPRATGCGHKKGASGEDAPWVL